MMFRAVLFATLGAACQSAPTCIAGPLHAGKEDIPIEEFVGHIGHAMSDIANKIADGDKDFKEFMLSRKSCQKDCFRGAFEPAFDTLVRMVGKDILKPPPDNIKDLMTTALTGAFRTCFPSAPRPVVLDLMHKVIGEITAGRRLDAGEDRRLGGIFEGGDKCTGLPGQNADAEKAFIEIFEKQMPEAMRKVGKAHPNEIKIFMEGSDCQNHCMDATMHAAVGNLWNSGLFVSENSEAAAVDALTGAIMACYPAASPDAVNHLFKEVAANINDQLDDITKLYGMPSYRRVVTTSSYFFPLAGVAAGVAVTAMAVGLWLGKRVQRSHLAGSLMKEQEDGLE